MQHKAQWVHKDLQGRKEFLDLKVILASKVHRDQLDFLHMKLQLVMALSEQNKTG